MKRFRAGIHWGKVLLVLACLSSPSALAENGSKTWTFDLPLPATYKVQVEHPVDVPKQPNVPVTYSIEVGGKTISRQIDLIANKVFIPLITDVNAPGKLRVAISGLSAADLSKTRVQVYDAAFMRPEQYVAATREVDFPEARQLRRLLAQPVAEMDLGRLKLSVDKLVDPKVDVDAGVRTLDAIAATIGECLSLGRAQRREFSR